MFKKRALKGAARKRDVDTGDDDVKSTPLTKTTPEMVLKSLPKAATTSQVSLRRLDDDDDDEAEKTRKRHKKPQRVPQYVEATAVVDYQPDVCKDFWLTGYCGYGDTCKFLHIRDELRQTVPLKKDWQVKRDSLDNDNGKISPQCPICQQKYTLPVETECHHLYCKRCYLHRFKKDKTCLVCGKETSGVIKPISQAQLDRRLPLSPENDVTDPEIAVATTATSTH